MPFAHKWSNMRPNLPIWTSADPKGPKDFSPSTNPLRGVCVLQPTPPRGMCPSNNPFEGHVAFNHPPPRGMCPSTNPSEGMSPSTNPSEGHVSFNQPLQGVCVHQPKCWGFKWAPLQGPFNQPFRVIPPDNAGDADGHVLEERGLERTRFKTLGGVG